MKMEHRYKHRQENTVPVTYSTQTWAQLKQLIQTGLKEPYPLQKQKPTHREIINIQYPNGVRNKGNRHEQTTNK